MVYDTSYHLVIREYIYSIIVEFQDQNSLQQPQYMDIYMYHIYTYIPHVMPVICADIL